MRQHYIPEQTAKKNKGTTTTKHTTYVALTSLQSSRGRQWERVAFFLFAANSKSPVGNP